MQERQPISLDGPVDHDRFQAPSRSRGPFSADQIREGDRLELSEGTPIYCAPAGPSHSRHNVTGAAILDSDPDVEWSATDAGFELKKNTMRAPDVSVAPPPTDKSEGGWILGAPPLAVEYADTGQNEADLQKKIKELLAAGTRYIWVVRLTGPRRVEVYTQGKPKRTLSATDLLKAPGVLRNPIPVHALFDTKEARRVILKNLLQREGYQDLNAVREEGKVEGKVEGLIEGEMKGRTKGRKEGFIEGEAKGRLEGEAKGHIKGRVEGQIETLFKILAARGLAMDAKTQARIRDCRDQEQLDVRIIKAVSANRIEDIF
uniref:Endonuclease, Uma2 family (Restriction endonuclease fold) n=1 Tax=Candidatus Kentrum sp. MB TaxID=2138164 RepID=A0A450XSV7_9GAMM|nr:MAG: Endonuclease, Uma2 family (restriction endonuclease fold) [Candidatus Kentron sp. MB]VFK32352.1 MAG: Endonuclease, Uma2 family (restriction endonuclease fold) [Candidatus Kentron sp. MB]VFK75844.1 MAG: Endonuclease, Uma2 family (restriction endonuclease fold) [Candidatus Kentron sp. MB]